MEDRKEEQVDEYPKEDEISEIKEEPTDEQDQEEKDDDVCSEVVSYYLAEVRSHLSGLNPKYRRSVLGELETELKAIEAEREEGLFASTDEIYEAFGKPDDLASQYQGVCSASSSVKMLDVNVVLLAIAGAFLFISLALLSNPIHEYILRSIEKEYAEFNGYRVTFTSYSFCIISPIILMVLIIVLLGRRMEGYEDLNKYVSEGMSKGESLRHLLFGYGSIRNVSVQDRNPIPSEYIKYHRMLLSIEILLVVSTFVVAMLLFIFNFTNDGMKSRAGNLFFSTFIVILASLMIILTYHVPSGKTNERHYALSICFFIFLSFYTVFKSYKFIEFVMYEHTDHPGLYFELEYYLLYTIIVHVCIILCYFKSLGRSFSVSSIHNRIIELKGKEWVDVRTLYFLSGISMMILLYSINDLYHNIEIYVINNHVTKINWIGSLILASQIAICGLLVSWITTIHFSVIQAIQMKREVTIILVIGIVASGLGQGLDGTTMTTSFDLYHRDFVGMDVDDNGSVHILITNECIPDIELRVEYGVWDIEKCIGGFGYVYKQYSNNMKLVRTAYLEYPNQEIDELNIREFFISNNGKIQILAEENSLNLFQIERYDRYNRWKATNNFNMTFTSYDINGELLSYHTLDRLENRGQRYEYRKYWISPLEDGFQIVTLNSRYRSGYQEHYFNCTYFNVDGELNSHVRFYNFSQHFNTSFGSTANNHLFAFSGSNFLHFLLIDPYIEPRNYYNRNISYHRIDFQGNELINTSIGNLTGSWYYPFAENSNGFHFLQSNESGFHHYSIDESGTLLLHDIFPKYIDEEHTSYKLTKEADYSILVNIQGSSKGTSPADRYHFQEFFSEPNPIIARPSIPLSDRYFTIKFIERYGQEYHLIISDRRGFNTNSASYSYGQVHESYYTYLRVEDNMTTHRVEMIKFNDAFPVEDGLNQKLKAGIIFAFIASVAFILVGRYKVKKNWEPHSERVSK